MLDFHSTEVTPVTFRITKVMRATFLIFIQTWANMLEVFNGEKNLHSANNILSKNKNLTLNMCNILFL